MNHSISWHPYQVIQGKIFCKINIFLRILKRCFIIPSNNCKISSLLHKRQFTIYLRKFRWRSARKSSSPKTFGYLKITIKSKKPSITALITEGDCGRHRIHLDSYETGTTKSQSTAIVEPIRIGVSHFQKSRFIKVSAGFKSYSMAEVPNYHNYICGQIK